MHSFAFRVKEGGLGVEQFGYISVHRVILSYFLKSILNRYKVFSRGAANAVFAVKRKAKNRTRVPHFSVKSECLRSVGEHIKALWEFRFVDAFIVLEYLILRVDINNGFNGINGVSVRVHAIDFEWKFNVIRVRKSRVHVISFYNNSGSDWDSVNFLISVNIKV